MWLKWRARKMAVRTNTLDSGVWATDRCVEQHRSEAKEENGDFELSFKMVKYTLWKSCLCIQSQAYSIA